MAKQKYNTSLLKWAGSKQKALKNLLPILEKHKRSTFVEPFVGAANVSLNFDCDYYVWNDLNPQLTDTYEAILSSRYLAEMYIRRCEHIFANGYEKFTWVRDQYNQEPRGTLDKISMFQYINKFGFNGLYRENQKGECNVPVGTIKKNLPKVPADQVRDMWDRFSGKVEVCCADFVEIFNVANLSDNCLIYSDPPYCPLTTDFKYTKGGFNKEDHIKLKEKSKQSKHTAIISNHLTPFTEELYNDADELYTFDVQRTISCNGKERKKVQEVVAVYLGKE